MNKEFYKRTIFEMLGDKSFYKQIKSQSTMETMKKVKKVISLAKETTPHEIGY